MNDKKETTIEQYRKALKIAKEEITKLTKYKFLLRQKVFEQINKELT